MVPGVRCGETLSRLCAMNGFAIPLRVLLVFATAAVVLGTAGCQPGEAGPRKACDLTPYRPDSPHISTHEAESKGRVVISANVRVVCDVPPEEHHLTVWLERSANGAWVTMVSQTFDNAPPKTGYRYTVAFVGCMAGEWRTRARAFGQLQGKPFAFEDRSLPRAISQQDCDDARRRVDGA